MANITAFEVDGSVGQLLGTANGLETEIHWHYGEFEATALYQFTSSRRREDMLLPSYPANTDQPHRADLLLIDHLPKNWIVASRFRYSSGFPRGPDPLTGIRLAPVEAFDILTQRVRPVAVSSDALRLRDFHALDVKFSKRFSFQNWQLDASLDVENLYNRRVAEPFITGFGESIPAYGFGLPILPIFGVEGLFYPRHRLESETSAR
jgi:outer membrane receptor protein involved in Fe transport